MNRDESIFLCSKGIKEKRNGNYTKALEFYLEAQLADFSNQDVYYNFGKIYNGLGKPEEAIRYLLVYLHLSIYNNTAIDLITGHRVFMNLLGLDYDGSIKQQLYLKNLELFNYKNKYGNSIISDIIRIPDSLVNFLCLFMPPLQLCVLDHNISFHAGFSFVLEDEIIQLFNEISSTEINDMKNGLLGKEYKKLLRSTYKENLFFVVGFLYLAINLRKIKNIVDIPSYYLDKNLVIKRDIENHQKYLESPESI